MKPVTLEYTKELSDFLNEELENNFVVEGDNIYLDCHNEQDLFNIGIDYGKWINSQRRVNNYLP